MQLVQQGIVLQLKMKKIIKDILDGLWDSFNVEKPISGFLSYVFLVIPYIYIFIGLKFIILNEKTNFITSLFEGYVIGVLMFILILLTFFFIIRLEKPFLLAIVVFVLGLFLNLREDVLYNDTLMNVASIIAVLGLVVPFADFMIKKYYKKKDGPTKKNRKDTKRSRSTKRKNK